MGKQFIQTYKADLDPAYREKIYNVNLELRISTFKGIRPESLSPNDLI